MFLLHLGVMSCQVLWCLSVYFLYIKFYRSFFSVYCEIEETNGVISFFFYDEFYIDVLLIEIYLGFIYVFLVVNYKDIIYVSIIYNYFVLN
jgi:hypothetical protein